MRGEEANEMPMHDVHPQWFNLNIATEEVLETLKEVETPLPVRIGERQVMEILGVMWNINGGVQATVGVDKESQVQAQITKRSQATIDLVPRNNIIDWVGFRETFNVVTSGVSYSMREQTIWHDFASSGKGPLLASQSIFTQVKSTTDVAAGMQLATAAVRILYKLVQVSAEELIGLVQE